MKIALDIGHANATGSRGNGLEEHAVAKAIIEHLAPVLQAQGHEAEVIDFPTLGNDPDLNKTVAAINAGSFDLSISVHCDCSDNPEAHGAHVCYNRVYHKTGIYSDSMKGKKLAVAISAHLCKLLPGRADRVQARPDRCKKLSSLYVLNKTNPPAVLCECGFISNSSDANILENDPGAIARAIAQGIELYYCYAGQ